jgi:hypothetical protein
MVSGARLTVSLLGAVALGGCAALLDLGSLERVGAVEGGDATAGDAAQSDALGSDGPPSQTDGSADDARSDAASDVAADGRSDARADAQTVDAPWDGFGIRCGASICTPTTQKCCHNKSGPGGSCELTTTTCTSGVTMECDDPQDCGGGTTVCCLLRTNMGNIQSIRCEPSQTACTPVGTLTAHLLCNPLGPACPTGTCTDTGWGFWQCQ